MSHPLVTVSTGSQVGTIKFNYQQHLNTLSAEFVADVARAIDDLSDPDTHCIILCANPGSKVFSAGHDVKELPTGNRDPLSYSDPLREITRHIQRCPKPVIAMVEGSVWGGAFELVMSCDLITAADTATFAFTPANLGVSYDMVGIQNIIRDCGYHFIKEMIFTAAPITAQRAHSVGLINHILPADQLSEFTQNLALTIAQKAPLVISLIKEELRVLGEARTMNSDEYERVQALRRKVYDSKDYLEGLKSFFERRHPSFTGE